MTDMTEAPVENSTAEVETETMPQPTTETAATEIAALDAAIAAGVESRLQAHAAEEDSRRQAQIAAWREEAEHDPVWGGDNFAAGVARAQLALSRFDTDKAIGRILEETGYGNHPAILRFFNRVADALAEDSPVSVYGSEGDAALLPLEDRMYGNM